MMMMMMKRLSSPAKRFLSIDYLTSSLEKPSTPPYTLSSLYDSRANNNGKESKTSQERNRQEKKLRKNIVSSVILNDIFLEEGIEPFTAKQIARSQTFFNNAKTELEWTIADYEEIPDVKVEKLQIDRLRKIERAMENSIGNSQAFNLSPKKTFGIKPQLLKPLPEVLIMGHTNVGKSSLINSLINPNESLSRTDQLAYVSAKAGYTKTLNCFNISRKLRFIDSPGYGERGAPRQGKVVIEYLEKRKLLKKVILLIDSIHGFHEEDMHIISHLSNLGIPFDIVFTKMDEVLRKYFKKDIFKKENSRDMIVSGNQAVLQHYNDLIESSGVCEIALPPKFMFNNAHVNKFISDFSGIKTIRCSILQGCNLL
ncbi:hypothetical protein KGF56_004265 [Candida oxycetoniae]|uniref:EngB-type G domain-containing protein n=1 Tax=Candida oxycetoniae TaxID=497107 RepID=A0AAI9STY8_9ASCO|nr:uncharacterized protein KGF56_004265 [Candida oxycetoniae]KAI3403012.2 hypothetical protein KGF56_004265 [Candida oxycetoniae]